MTSPEYTLWLKAPQSDAGGNNAPTCCCGKTMQKKG